MCITITSGMALYALLKIAAPALTLYNEAHSAHQDVEQFRRSHLNPDNRQEALYFPQHARPLALNHKPAPQQATGQAPERSDEDWDKLRQQSYQGVLANHRRSALQDLLRLAMVLLVSGALFAVHWRFVRRQDPGT